MTVRAIVRWLVALACIAGATLRAADVPTAAPYRLKAVFLFNFTQFVTWPPAAFASEASPFVIGVLGENPFGTALVEATRGEKVGGRPIVVQAIRRAEDAAACHILFVGDVGATLGDTLARLAGRPVLTVADTPGFCARGGTIEMATANNRLRLTVNLAAARAAGLEISSKLLRVADVFPPATDAP
jgi:hypothetical protein